MSSDAKVISAVLGVTLLIIVGAIFINGRSNSGGKTTSEQIEAGKIQETSGLTVAPQPFSLGDVPIKGGVVKFSFKLKNETGQALKLSKIETSCMCTEAAVKANGKETGFYGMEMPGMSNPQVNLAVDAGVEAELLVKFDPAAHGPEGVGPFERTVRLTFTDPMGYRDIGFNGTVVK